MQTLEGLSAAKRVTRLGKEANKEGKLLWTTSANLDRIRPVVEAWRRKYPRVDIEYNQLSGRVPEDRMIREYRLILHYPKGFMSPIFSHVPKCQGEIHVISFIDQPEV